MAKKGENIYKRRDGRYEARYVKKRDDNNRIVEYGYVYGKTYTEAKIKKNFAIRNMDASKNNSNELFSISIDKWLSSKNSIKNSTYYNYVSIVNSNIKPYFKSKKIYNVTDDDIIKFTAFLYNKRLSNKRIRDILLVLKQFFKYKKNIQNNNKLNDNNRLRNNRIIDIILVLIQFFIYKKININIEYSKLKKKSLQILNEKEVKLLQDKLINGNIKDFCIVLTLFTGLRIGELCALRWSDINIKDQEIYVDKTLVRVQNDGRLKTKLVLDTPKTDTSIRVVPLHDKLIPYLTKFKQNQSDDSFILTGTNNFMPYHTYYNYYKARIESLHMKKYTFHVLRHTFASRALISGIDIKTLSEILGHSSVKITLDRYVHIRQEEKLVQINKLTFFV